MPNFPTTVDWLLHPLGQFVFLDGGVLDLGVIRDAELVATNDYEVFAETFENVGQVGPADAALHGTSTVCANGFLPSMLDVGLSRKVDHYPGSHHLTGGDLESGATNL